MDLHVAVTVTVFGTARLAPAGSQGLMGDVSVVWAAANLYGLCLACENDVDLYGRCTGMSELYGLS